MSECRILSWIYATLVFIAWVCRAAVVPDPGGLAIFRKPVFGWSTVATIVFNV